MRIEASTPAPVLSTPQNHKDYRADIDGLRAIAACSIVLFHAFPQALRGGFVGVDVFFVISGYLIGKIILSGVATNTLSFADFYARRIKRIFPALLIVLAACYAFGWVTLLPGDYKELGKHVASGAGFVSNFALWTEAGYFDAAAETKPLLHLWSLGIEEQFYIFWPLLLWLCGRFRINALIPIAAVCIASFALNVLTIHSHPTAAFYSPLSRIWELLIGTLLAYQHLNNRSILPGRSAIKSVLGALLIIVPIASLPQSVAFPGWWALLPTVGTYLMIDAGSQAWLSRRVLATKVFVWFGAISFPLYLGIGRFYRSRASSSTARRRWQHAAPQSWPASL
ncbi:acyltransferase 3 [Cupriavidus basilensis OR16]|uniref:Acyltransferase 3 n=1 Tax=Cupriavidus basilensis OR16 TaxID=1127483 RepID=H1SB55_9BURK|nr:acyltransferase [Cupriavidus basilensis]EHP40293.1 acyltransferase 3 [Cupriavidus basilensis OR16]